MLIVAWGLAVLALILLVFATLRLIRAHEDRAFIRRIDEAVSWNPAGAKYPPTLTEEEVAEFNSVRWD